LLSFTNLCEGLPDNWITDWLLKKCQDGALARLRDWKYEKEMDALNHDSVISSAIIIPVINSCCA
jgi:hypothetical protein